MQQMFGGNYPLWGNGVFSPATSPETGGGGAAMEHSNGSAVLGVGVPMFPYSAASTAAAHTSPALQQQPHLNTPNNNATGKVRATRPFKVQMEILGKMRFLFSI